MTESYEIIQVTEEEMWEKLNSNGDAGVPRFYSVSRSGLVQFYPRIDATRIRLFCTPCKWSDK